MKTSLLLIAAFALGFVSCNNEQHKIETDKPAISLNQPPPLDGGDTTLVKFTLNPKFDENKIHGLGIFKIGVPVENSVALLLKGGNYKLDSVNNEMRRSSVERKYKKGDNLVLKLNPPVKVNSEHERILVNEYNFVSYDKRAATYTINNYTVDNLKLHDLALFYYDDKLVALSCSFNDELKKAIEDKYGVTDAGAYSNGDIKAGDVSGDYEISIKGASDFLQASSSAAFTTLDSIEKNTKPSGGLKDL